MFLKLSVRMILIIPIQYWRLFSHHLVCANSSDLLLVELLLYNSSIRIERTFGRAKFAVGCRSLNGLLADH